ncbi:MULTISPECIES: hypothetical protein [Sphingomonadaceae]|uniref:hypothetical protein n=1 Tax=Sphingomonadales TaxID=204457 RepID=UPI000A45C230|nr:hypothetical protein [Sphingobium sp. TKS]MCF8706634.1 hypothetical protein [Rhizorhapis sp. SPR117]
MRKLLRTAVLAGAAAAAIAGTALAAANHNRVMTVDLPDGSLARIEYQGDVAPKVTVEPVLQFVPVGLTDLAIASPITLFDRIAADMDRQFYAMLQRVRMIDAATATGATQDRATFDSLPAGTVSYRFVSTSTGNGMCSRSIQVISLGADRQPKVVSSSSGDCGAPTRAPIPAVATPEKPEARPNSS